jgi:gliding motility-associated-like protein
VNALPVAAFSATVPCANQTTSFTDNTPPAVAQWQWDFGDLTSSALQNPAHQYAAAGNYNVQLIVTTAGGCSDTITNAIVVYPQPVAQFTTNTVCYGDTTKITNTSFSTQGAIVSTFWDYGDGNTGTVPNADHEFQMYNDSFLVTLIVATQYGCVDTLQQLVLLYPVPDMQFAPAATSGCEDFTVTFSETSVLNGSTVVNWMWDLGDGNFTYTQNPTHTYDDPGSFYPSLQITTSDGCTFADTMNFPIVVYPKPVSDFSYAPQPVTIIQPEVEFTDLSSGAMYWEYDFGDFDGSIQQHPVHSYADTGHYTVQQIVINQYGCADTSEQIVPILAEFTYFIPNAFTPNGNGNNEFFIGQGEGIREFTMYIFDRWGNLMYETHNQHQGWDGTSGGAPCQQDAYVYRIIIRDVLGEEHKYMGHVSLIR